MNKLSLYILLAGMMLMIASCTNNQGNVTPFVTEQAQPLNTPNHPIAETEKTSVLPTQMIINRAQDLEHVRTKYDLKVHYDYSSHILRVKEDITYVNNTSTLLNSIKITLPFKEGHGFQMTELMVNQVDQTEFEISNNLLSIPLVSSINSGETIQLSLSYTILIPDSGGILGRTNRQINLADFYPMIPHYDEIDGWIVHEPGAVGEYLVYAVADFELEFSTNAPGDFQVFSNAPLAINSNAYLVSARNYRNLVVSMCFDCSKIEMDYGAFKVIGGFDTQDEKTGKETLTIIAKALVYFSNVFGVDYPHNQMTIIEADFPDGMEYDGLFFLSKDYFYQYDQSFMNYLSLLTVHETAHQWWFGVVANDQAIEPWLDEALATYSEYLFLEEFYPELTDWWWSFRVDSFEPVGSPGASIYEFDKVRPYINAVYLRGAHFVHDLRNLLTDEVFFDRLRAYAIDNQYLISSSEAFYNIFIPEQTPEERNLLDKYFTQ